MSVSHEDLALASEASYKDRPEGAELDSAYQAHTVLISKGYENIGVYRDDETGFYAEVWQKEVDGKKEIIVSTRGTDFTTGKDWYANTGLGDKQFEYIGDIESGDTSDAYKLKEYLSNLSDSNDPIKSISFTGHSLGGALAQYYTTHFIENSSETFLNSIEIDLITFNSLGGDMYLAENNAGWDESAVTKYIDDATHYRIDGDAVSKLGAGHLGNTVKTLTVPIKTDTYFEMMGYAVAAHGMGQFFQGGVENFTLSGAYNESVETGFYLNIDQAQPVAEAAAAFTIFSPYNYDEPEALVRVLNGLVAAAMYAPEEAGPLLDAFFYDAPAMQSLKDTIYDLLGVSSEEGFSGSAAWAVILVAISEKIVDSVKNDVENNTDLLVAAAEVYVAKLFDAAIDAASDVTDSLYNFADSIKSISYDLSRGIFDFFADDSYFMGSSLNDVFEAGSEGSFAFGLSGDDELHSGSGDDLLVGGTGSDTYYWNNNNGDSDGNDTIIEVAEEGIQNTLIINGHNISDLLLIKVDDESKWSIKDHPSGVYGIAHDTNSNDLFILISGSHHITIKNYTQGDFGLDFASAEVIDSVIDIAPDDVDQTAPGGQLNVGFTQDDNADEGDAAYYYEVTVPGEDSAMLAGRFKDIYANWRQTYGVTVNLADLPDYDTRQAMQPGQSLLPGELSWPIFSLNTSPVAYFVGNDVSDELNGGHRGDWLLGQGGDDVIFGHGGVDHLLGGEGADTLVGGDGDDLIAGHYFERAGAGSDYDADASAHNFDFLNGGAGNDTLVGYQYDDVLVGGQGQDKIYAGLGADTISGGDDGDVIWGDSNYFLEWEYPLINGQEWTVSLQKLRWLIDSPEGHNNDDFILGGGGNDNILGEFGNDTIFGEEGDDVIVGDRVNDPDFVLYPKNPGLVQTANFEYQLSDEYVQQNQLGYQPLSAVYHGNDTLYGDIGNDWIYGNGGDDFLAGGDGGDRLYGDDYALDGQFHGRDELHGGDGYDRLYGGGNDDVLYGDAGNDVLFGDIHVEGSFSVNYQTADVSISTIKNGTVGIANHGADRLYGGEGDDVIFGNSGDDVLEGGSGNDYLFGGADNDTLKGGAGQDVMAGGYGNDVYVITPEEDHIDTIIDIDDANKLDIRGIAVGALHLSWLQQEQGYLLSINADKTAGVFMQADTFSHMQTIRVAGVDMGRLAFIDMLVANGQATIDSIQGTDADETYEMGDHNLLVYGLAGDDTLIGNGQDNILNGGDGNDAMYAVAGSNQLYGGNGDDHLYSGSGDDYLDAGYGNDHYHFDMGDGHDVINDSRGVESLHLGSGITRDSVSWSRVGNDLKMTVDAENSITFKYYFQSSYNWTVNDYRQIENILFDGGSEPVTIHALQANELQNVAPNAVNDVLDSSAEDTIREISFSELLQNDLDSDTDLDKPLTITGAVITYGAGSVFVDKENEKVIVRPSADYHGLIRFNYTVSDGRDTDSAQASFEVSPVLDPLEAGNDSINALTGKTMQFNAADFLMANDAVGDFSNASVSEVTSLTEGVEVDYDGETITLTAEYGLSGAAQLSYTIEGNYDVDGQYYSNAGTVDVQLEDQAQYGYIAGSTEVFDPDMPRTMDIPLDTLIKRTVGEGAVFIGMVPDSVQNGDAFRNGARIRFLPPEGFIGLSSFSFYYEKDGEQGVETVWINNAAGSNEDPVIGNDVITGFEDPETGEVTPYVEDDGIVRVSVKQLLANDIDVDGDALTIERFFDVKGMHYLKTEDGIALFELNKDFSGTARFSYAVSDGFIGEGLPSNGFVPLSIGTSQIMVEAVNDAPVLGDDVLGSRLLNFADNREGDEHSAPAPVLYVRDGESFQFTIAQLLANDFDADGDMLTVTDLSVDSSQGTLFWENDQIITDESTGHAWFKQDAVITFTAAAGFEGAAAITYSLTDEDPTSFEQQYQANVYVNVTNDPKLIPVGLNYDQVSQNHGDLTIHNFNGDYQLTEDAFFWDDYFDGYSYNNSDDNKLGWAEHEIRDQISIVDVIGGQALANVSIDQDVDELGSPVWTFKPNEYIGGYYTVDYIISNGQFVNYVSDFHIEHRKNGQYQAFSDYLTTIDGSTSFSPESLLSNDNTGIYEYTYSLPGEIHWPDAAFVREITGLNNSGSISVDGGVYTFTAADDFFGKALFLVEIDTGRSQSAFSLLTIQVGEPLEEITPQIDVSLAQNDVITAQAGVSITIDFNTLLANDADGLAADAIKRFYAGDNIQFSLSDIDWQNGTITVTPISAAAGDATFSYVVGDGNGNFDTATVTVHVESVEPVNQAPVTAADYFSVTADTALEMTFADLLANDSDPDGDVLSIVRIENASNGLVTIDWENQTVLFEPEAGFEGDAGFDYVVSDGQVEVSQSVNISVAAAANNSPIAQEDVLDAVEDQVRVIGFDELLSNDSDPDGNALTIAAINGDDNGSYELNETDRQIIYTPTADFNGEAVFSYTVSDGEQTVQGQVTINVAPVNDTPITVADVLAGVEDEIRIIGFDELLGNDSDADGDVLTITAVNGDGNGQYQLDAANSQIIFTPNADFNGEASFTYTASDGDLTDQGQVTINVAPVNDAPVTVADVLAGVEDEVRIIGFDELLGNDSDVDGDALTIIAVNGDGNGQYQLDSANSQIIFTPDADFNGEAVFSYTVSDGELETEGQSTINVAPVNDAPVAGDDVVAGIEDQVTRIAVADLLANDADVDITTGGDGSSARGQVLSFNAVAGYHTNMGITTDTYQYQPGMTFRAEIQIADTLPNYEFFTGIAVYDGDEIQPSSTSNQFYAVLRNEGVFAATSRQLQDWLDGGNLFSRLVYAAGKNYIFELQTFNDHYDVYFYEAGSEPGEPFVTASYPAGANPWPEGMGFSFYATQGENAPDGAPSPVTIDNASLTLDDGSFLFNESFDTDTGVFSHFYQILLPIGVYNAEDYLHLLLSEDTSADLTQGLSIIDIQGDGNGTYVLDSETQEVVFTPNADFNGDASFSYTVSDGELTDQGQVTITVAPVNDAPVAEADMLAGVEDEVLVIDFEELLGNDSDVDGDALTITAVTGGDNGQYQLDDINRQIIYTPNANFNGDAVFSYTVSDGELTDEGQATINVAPVNDAPVAETDVLAGVEDEVLVISFDELLGNDSDVDGDALTITAVTGDGNGQYQLDGDDRQIIFTPNADFNGETAFSYTVNDGEQEAEGQVTINVAPVNDAPVAEADVIQSIEDEVRTISFDELLGNDSDVDGDALTITAVTGDGNGQYQLDEASRQIIYTPTADFYGAALFTYTVNDGELAHEAQVAIDVAAVNDAPTAGIDDIAVLRNGERLITYTELLANDMDVDGDALSIVGIVPGDVGSYQVDEINQTVRFTPANGFTGTTSFEYMVSDGHMIVSGGVNLVVDRNVNVSPVAGSDFLVVQAGQLSVIDESFLMANDVDPNRNDELQFVDIGDSTNGFVARDPESGLITFTSETGFNGLAGFTYQISDGELNSMGSVSLYVVDDVDTVTVAGGRGITRGSAGDDVIVGSVDNDHLRGGTGDDRYIILPGGGVDIIENRNADDADILHYEGLGQFGLWFSQDKRGNDLAIDVIGSDDRVVLADWYRNQEVDQVVVGDLTLDANAIHRLVDAMSAFAVPSSTFDPLPENVRDVYESVLAASA